MLDIKALVQMLGLPEDWERLVVGFYVAYIPVALILLIAFALLGWW